MSKFCYAIALFLLSVQSLYAKDVPPQYLYKVLSVENWQKSEDEDLLQLPEEDKEFIHLSREDQLERIIAKYWSKVPEFVILKIDSRKLQGKMVFEINPGGVTKYWHLYNGSIPMNAVVDSQIIQTKESSQPPPTKVGGLLGN